MHVSIWVAQRHQLRLKKFNTLFLQDIGRTIQYLLH